MTAAETGQAGSWNSVWLRMGVHALTAAVVVFPLATLSGVVAAVIGAVLGVLAARFVAASRVRTAPLVAAVIVGLIGVSLFRATLVFSADLAHWLGPTGALLCGDAVLFGMSACLLSLGMRTLSTRRSVFTVFEVGTVAFGFAALLVAHRHGAIHRPYEIADPLLVRGEDPTLALLLIGALGAAAIGALLLSEKSLLRSALHLSVVGLVLLLILATTAMVGLPPPPPSGDALGLRDDQSQGSGGGGGGSGSGRQRNDQLEFRDNYDNAQSQAPVGVVLLHDDYSPPSGVYYFRQGAFSQYNGRRMVEATRRGADEDLARQFPSGDLAVTPWRPTLTMNGDGDSRTPAQPLFSDDRLSVETTVALLADHARPFGLEAPVSFRATENPNPQRFQRTYRVRSEVLNVQADEMLARRAGDAAWDEALMAHYTESPDDPRYAEMAERIIHELPDDLAGDVYIRALAVSQYLGHHGTYSLRSEHASAEDPTAHFLFGDLTGYCVHFAHAAVFLMRSAGLPARVATGYAVSESSRQGGSSILVRSSDSHAWPEVFVENAGWVVVDVSPETVLSEPPGPPDPELQRLLGEMARGQNSMLEDAPQPPRSLRALAEELRDRTWPVISAVFLALLFGGYAVKLFRRIAPLWVPVPRRPKALYRRTLDRLVESGVRRDWGESPESFSSRWHEQLPGLTPLVAGHLAASFGQHRSTEDVARMERASRELQIELRATVPRWRRFLGLLNPYSWLWVR